MRSPMSNKPANPNAFAFRSAMCLTEVGSSWSFEGRGSHRSQEATKGYRHLSDQGTNLIPTV
jgi:hypothetical protein